MIWHYHILYDNNVRKMLSHRLDASVDDHTCRTEGADVFLDDPQIFVFFESTHRHKIPSLPIIPSFQPQLFTLLKHSTMILYVLVGVTIQGLSLLRNLFLQILKQFLRFCRHSLGDVHLVGHVKITPLIAIRIWYSLTRQSHHCPRLCTCTYL